jgi:hypothetical protein
MSLRTDTDVHCDVDAVARRIGMPPEAPYYELRLFRHPPESMDALTVTELTDEADNVLRIETARTFADTLRKIADSLDDDPDL